MTCENREPVIDIKFRDQIQRVTDPLGRGLVRAHLSADVLTVTGVAVGGIAAWQAAEGHLFVAALIGTFACLFDLLDGAAAKAASTTSRRGSYLDSVADRVSESIMYFGLLVYCVRFRSPPFAYMLMVAFAAAQVTSYTRAKADALGVDGKAGFMERAERQLTLGVMGLIPKAFVPGLVFLAAATSLTAFYRMVVVWIRITRTEGAAPAGRVAHLATARQLRRERRQALR